jgi:hypothetical protein
MSEIERLRDSLGKDVKFQYHFINKAGDELFKEYFFYYTVHINKEDLFETYYFNKYTVSHDDWLFTYPIFELYCVSSYSRYPVVYPINIFRSRWDAEYSIDMRRGMYPKSWAEVPDAYAGIMECITVLPRESLICSLLDTTVVNYFLRYLDYPCVSGVEIAKNGVSQDIVESELLKSLELWNKYKR